MRAGSCQLMHSTLQSLTLGAQRPVTCRYRRWLVKKNVCHPMQQRVRRRPMDLSLRNLEEAVSIRRQIDNLERRLNTLVGSSGGRAAATTGRRRRRRRMSAATRAKLSAAARARWARQRGGGRGGRGTRRRRSGITAAGRRRLSQLMKARWAARKKAAGAKK